MENYYSYEASKSFSLTKVFGYMFLGLLISALSAIGVYYIIYNKEGELWNLIILMIKLKTTH